MFRFKFRQEILEIGNVKIGEQLGELPTVLIGNIFYGGMSEVTNHKKGEFDRKSALRWVKIAEELSGRTGNPHFIDIMAMYTEAIKQYIIFISEHSDSVFLVDGANSETRIAALETVRDLRLQEKVARACEPSTHHHEQRLHVMRPKVLQMNSNLKPR